MRQSLLLPAVLLFVLPATTSQAQNTQRGATFGGLAGAIAGGLIGDHNGEAGAGALIGGALGAVAGGVVGNARDKELAYGRSQMQYQAQQQAYQQQYAAAAAAQQAVSIDDVIQMSRSGLSETVLTNQIMQRGVQRRLEVSDIIALHQSGVSESVIGAMQRATVGAPAPAIAAAPASAPVTPVYVERRYEVVPTYVVPAPRYYYHDYHDYHHHHHHRRGSHWDVSIGF